MNRTQTYIFTTMSFLVAVFLIGHIFLTRQVNFEQNRLAAAQQALNNGQTFQADIKALAMRTYQDAQKTNDPGLKELLTRNQISFTPAPASSAAPVGPASPTPTPAPVQ